MSNSLAYEVRVSTENGVDVKYPQNGNSLDGLCGDANGITSLSGATQTTVSWLTT